MKTKLLTLAIFTMATLLTAPVYAQVSFGTRHGLAISTLSKTGDFYDNDEMHFSYTGGRSQQRNQRIIGNQIPKQVSLSSDSGFGQVQYSSFHDRKNQGVF
jgi:hypothetical protein